MLVGSEDRVQFCGFLGVVILRVDDPIEVAYLPLICGILPRSDLSYSYYRFRELMWGIGVGVSRACWKVGNRIAWGPFTLEEIGYESLAILRIWRHAIGRG